MRLVNCQREYKKKLPEQSATSAIAIVGGKAQFPQWHCRLMPLKCVADQLRCAFIFLFFRLIVQFYTLNLIFFFFNRNIV